MIFTFSFVTALAALFPSVLGHGYVQQVKFDSPAATYPGYNYNTVSASCFRALTSVELYQDPYYSPPPARLVRKIPGNGPVMDLSLIEYVADPERLAFKFTCSQRPVQRLHRRELLHSTRCSLWYRCCRLSRAPQLDDLAVVTHRASAHAAYTSRDHLEAIIAGSHDHLHGQGTYGLERHDLDARLGRRLVQSRAGGQVRERPMGGDGRPDRDKLDLHVHGSSLAPGGPIHRSPRDVRSSFRYKPA
jgi:hypothetical protein